MTAEERAVKLLVTSSFHYDNLINVDTYDRKVEMDVAMRDFSKAFDVVTLSAFCRSYPTMEKEKTSIPGSHNSLH